MLKRYGHAHRVGRERLRFDRPSHRRTRRRWHDARGSLKRAGMRNRRWLAHVHFGRDGNVPRGIRLWIVLAVFRQGRKAR